MNIRNNWKEANLRRLKVSKSREEARWGGCTSLLGAIVCSMQVSFLLIGLVIVRITLNVILRQISLNVRYTTVCSSIKNLWSNSQIRRQCYFRLLRHNIVSNENVHSSPCEAEL